MDTTPIPREWKEFLKLLIANDVDFMLIGGLAVAYYGYPRATFDLDIWVNATPANAKAIGTACSEFGLDVPADIEQVICEAQKTLRFGRQPLRIELLSKISGINFVECKPRAITGFRDGIEFPLISLKDLKANKQASGRLKDLDDLENLPAEQK
jgi:hypothetical protein